MGACQSSELLETERRKKLIQKYRCQVLYLDNEVSYPVDFVVYRGCTLDFDRDEKTRIWSLQLKIKTQGNSSQFMDFHQSSVRQYQSVVEEKKQEYTNKLIASKKKIEAAYLIYLKNTGQEHLIGKEEEVQEAAVVLEKV